jgi:hypothetical protein
MGRMTDLYRGASNIASDVTAHFKNLLSVQWMDFVHEYQSDERRWNKLKQFLYSSPDTAILGSKQFAYQKLPEGGSAIRLIRLLPGNDLDEIWCSLETASLDARYEALSYVWGKEEPHTPILCNGTQIGVTHNLKIALNGLRLPDRERTLWVDAICINQKDEAEKAQQLTMMREIYKAAERTVAYLGETSTFTRLSFRVLYQLRNLYQDVMHGAITFAEIKPRSRTIAVDGYGATIPFLVAVTVMSAFQAALWFTRMWVRQVSSVFISRYLPAPQMLTLTIAVGARPR